MAQKATFKTRKQLRSEKIKKAKEKYNLSRKHSSNEFQRLRQYAGYVLSNLHKVKFDSGNLKIGILK